MSIEQQVREYIHANFLFSADAIELGGDESFLETGILDSTGIQELIFFLEQKFNVKILDEDINRENLDSLHKVVVFVQKKQTQA